MPATMLHNTSSEPIAPEVVRVLDVAVSESHPLVRKRAPRNESSARAQLSKIVRWGGKLDWWGDMGVSNVASRE